MSVESVAKVLGGGIVIGAGVLLNNPALIGAGAGLAGQGVIGALQGDEPEPRGLSQRASGILANNRTNPGAAIPVVYGTARLGCIVCDYRTAGTNNKDLWIPAVICHGDRSGQGIASFEQIYFDDREAVDTDGDPVSPFTASVLYHVQILGEDAADWASETLDSTDLETVSGSWAAADEGAGLAGILFKLVYDQDIYPRVPVITAVVKGNHVEDTRDEITGTISFNTTTEVINHADVSDGAWAAGDLVEVTSGACQGWYTVESVSGDDITVEENLPSTTSYSTTIKRWAHPDNGGDNPALCIRDYLLSDVYGPGISESLIDETSFEAIANYCDATEGGGTRYTCNGWVDTGRSVASNLEELLSSCRGSLVYEGGAYRLFVPRTVTPISTWELNEDNIVGDWEFVNAGADAKYNVVRATFVNPNRDYATETVEHPDPNGANSYLTADNSWENRLTIQLPFTNDYEQAERNALVRLQESREGVTAAVTCTEEAFKLQVGDVIPVTHSTPGWSSKNFWVWAIVPTMGGQCRVLLREYESNSYTMPGLQTEPSSPDTDLPNPFSLEPPTGVTQTLEWRQVGGRMLPFIRVKWTGADYAYGNYYEVYAKRQPDILFTTVTYNSTGDYIDLSSGYWEDYLYRVGDLISCRSQAGGASTDGVYQIASMDRANRRIYTEEAIPANRGPVVDAIGPVNPYKSYGIVPARKPTLGSLTPVEDFLIGPIDIGDRAQRWRVKVVLRNILGMQSRPAHNLLEYSDDFSQWNGVNNPVVTTGQSDPDGGSNACLINDDSAVVVKYVRYGYSFGTSFDPPHFDTTSRKRCKVSLKAGTATTTRVRFYDYSSAGNDLSCYADITWSAGVPSVSITNTNGTMGLVRARDEGSGWYWFEFYFIGIRQDSFIETDIYPAGATAADTGTVYAYRFCWIDDDRDIVAVQTAGTPSCDLTVNFDVASASTTYSVARGDNFVMCDVTGGAFTVTMPKALEYPGREVVVKLIAGDGGTSVTVAAATGDTVETATVGPTVGALIRYVSDANNNYWRAVGT